MDSESDAATSAQQSEESSRLEVVRRVSSPETNRRSTIEIADHEKNDVSDDSTDDDVPIMSLKRSREPENPSNEESGTVVKTASQKRKLKFRALSPNWKTEFYEGRYHEARLKELYAISLTGQIEYFRYFFDRQKSHGRPFLPGNRQHDDMHYLDLAFTRQLPVQLDQLIPGLEIQEEIRIRASDLAYLFAEQRNSSVDNFLAKFDYGALLALGLLIREYAKDLIHPILHDLFYKPVR